MRNEELLALAIGVALGLVCVIALLVVIGIL
jgi:hypothetical protein